MNRWGYFLATTLWVFTSHANDTFPCDLKSLKQPLPQLILLGEIHGTQAADDIEKESKALVKAGKILYGREADFNDDLSYSKKAHKRSKVEYVPGVVGIDDPIAHSMATLMKAWNDPPTHTDQLYGVFEAAHNHRLLKSLWISTLTKLTTEQEKAVSGFIDILITTDSNVNSKFFEDRATMKSIIEKWTMVLAEYAYRPENRERYLAPPELPKLVNEYFHGPVDTSIIFKGFWRDILMSRNTAKLYCEAAAKGLDLRVSVGNQHVPGMKFLLKNLAKDVTLPIVDKNKNADGSPITSPNFKLYWKTFAN